MADPSLNECRIDGFGPLPVVTPQSVAELGDTVRGAAAANQAVYPLGGRTMLDLGLPPGKSGIAVDLTGLDPIIDYPARDMTITVQSGITMARLQSVLAAEKQQLPVDVPRAERATLGGVLATNVSGPRRYGYGTLRDYVIGISLINDQGQEVKAGGRVVKNVAGYDMCKLYIGSLGTLGLITQVTLKLRPLPEARAALALACHPTIVSQLVDVLHRSPTRPVCRDVVNHSLARALKPELDHEFPDTSWVVILEFEDNQEAVRWQIAQLHRDMAGATANGDVTLWSIPDPVRLRQRCMDRLTRPECSFAFKANLLPQATASFCALAESQAPSLWLQAHAGNGIVIGQVNGDLTLDRAQTMLKTLQTAAVAAQGNVIVLRCPPDWKATLPIWGAPRGDAWLMRAIKEKLDPGRLFNPGRFVEGL